MSEIDGLSELIGKPVESVPVVDPADLKAMWVYLPDTEGRASEIPRDATDFQLFSNKRASH